MRWWDSHFVYNHKIVYNIPYWVKCQHICANTLLWNRFFYSHQDHYKTYAMMSTIIRIMAREEHFLLFWLLLNQVNKPILLKEHLTRMRRWHYCVLIEHCWKCSITYLFLFKYMEALQQHNCFGFRPTTASISSPCTSKEQHRWIIKRALLIVILMSYDYDVNH